MSNCTHYEPIIAQRYHDGELSEGASDSFEAHLASCPACQAALRSWAAIGMGLRDSILPAMPAGLTERLARRARERQLQSSRRIAWSLLAAASVLLVSSLFLVGYSQAGEGDTPTIMAQWEEYVIASPVADEEYTDLESKTLVAIHIRKAPTSESGND